MQPPATKHEVRRQLLALRRERVTTAGDGEAIAARVRALLPDHPVTVTAYVSTEEEPDTGPLLEMLTEVGHRVLLPVVLPDLDLDWAAYEGPASIATTDRGLTEPTGLRLGVDAVAAAAVVVCPGLAGTPDGHRLGRGGGCYDRALARTDSALRLLLLHDAEVTDWLPTDPHDQRVDALVTASRTVRRA